MGKESLHQHAVRCLCFNVIFTHTVNFDLDADDRLILK
jgi:hypothetical protein